MADGAYSVYATDVDGDGDIDVLSASQNNNRITWHENDGGALPAFTSRTVANNANWAVSVYAADVDQDGDIDILSASYDDDKIAWHENDGGSPPAFTGHVVTVNANGARSVYATDVDGDGDPDILSASENDNKIAWYPNQTIHRSAFYPSQAHVVITNTAYGARMVYAADVDSDGDLDVLSASARDNRIAWYESNGNAPPTFTYRVITNNAKWAVAVYAIDLDGDSDLDVLSASVSDDKIAWYQNDGGSPPAFTTRVIANNANGAWSVFAADVDGDGDLDVLSGSAYDDKIVWYENNGNATPAFTSHVITTNADGARSVYASDIDNDGDLDVFSASYADDKIAWYENDGAPSPTFTLRIITNATDGAHWVHTADMDNDGDLDVLSAAWDGGQVAWYENNGGSPPAFTGRIVASTDGASSIYATDLDGDGDLDILSALAEANQIVWYESDGGAPPAFTPHTITQDTSQAISAYAADVDGDGDLDVLSASEYDDTVAWYENRGGQFALTTTDTAPMTVLNGQQDDVLCIVATHRGRSDDTAAELVTFELLFQNSTGNPLTTNQANNLVNNLHIYRDDGSGSFESGADIKVITVGTLSLTSGLQTIAFADGNPNARLNFGIPITYFVVVELTNSAASQTPHQLRVTHVTEPTGPLASRSTAEDEQYDLPLTLEFAPNVASSLLAATDSFAEFHVHLPIVLKNFSNYVPPCSVSNNYCEDYDTYDSAYGPLQPGVVYPAYPDDSTDYYYFELGATKNATVQVQNYQATGDLILYEHREGSSPVHKANWGKGGPTMTLTLSLEAGKYYVRVFTTGGYNTSTLYTLKVSW